MHHHAPRPILIVDDSPDDLFLTRRLLAKAGATNPIVCIEGGPDVITFLTGAIAEHSSPCMVLLDVKMPGYDGFEILQWARRHQALERTPIVMHSSSNHVRDRARAEKLGATAYLVKPLTLEDVRHLLEQFCGAAQGTHQR